MGIYEKKVVECETCDEYFETKANDMTNLRRDNIDEMGRKAGEDGKREKRTTRETVGTRWEYKAFPYLGHAFILGVGMSPVL